MSELTPKVFAVEIKAHDALYLSSDAIHATTAMDDTPTFHLHLYGRPLTELPPYAARCYPPSAVLPVPSVD